jgi:quinol monooxygenase YgiN
VLVALIVLWRWLVVRLAIGLSAPERAGRRIATALRVLIIPTRLEPGCLSCTIWTELGEDFRVHYEERWSNEEAMRHRVLSDAFTKLLEVLEASPARPSVEFDFVAKRMGLEYIEMVRGDDPLQPAS